MQPRQVGRISVWYDQMYGAQSGQHAGQSSWDGSGWLNMHNQRVSLLRYISHQFSR